VRGIPASPEFEVLELLEVEVAVPEGEMDTGPLVIPIEVMEPVSEDWL